MILENATLYVIVPWPEVQRLMDCDGFDEHCYSASDDQMIKDWGAGAYFCDYEWVKAQNIF